MNYEEFRDAGHYLIDYITDYLKGVQDKPLFPNVEPSVLNELFDEPAPNRPASLSEIQKMLEVKLVPYCTHVNHAGYMGLITPTPSLAGILGDLLAAALNQNLGVYSIGPSAVTMELRVIRWLNDIIGYGNNAGVVLQVGA
jgi:glutamate/tyrosine decarboxylase-like PLP-dependent enzyme